LILVDSFLERPCQALTSVEKRAGGAYAHSVLGIEEINKGAVAKGPISAEYLAEQPRRCAIRHARHIRE
jgi:hypothetical protein